MKTTITERLSVNGHYYEIEEESQLIEGIKVNHRNGYFCPRCGEDLEFIEHGHGKECKCGLFIKIYGASMQITGEI